MASEESAQSRLRLATLITGILASIYIFVSVILFLQALAEPQGSWLSVVLGQELSIWASSFAYFAVTWIGLVVILTNLVLDIKLLFGKNVSENDNMLGLIFAVPSGTALGLVIYLYFYALLMMIR